MRYFSIVLCLVFLMLALAPASAQTTFAQDAPTSQSVLEPPDFYKKDALPLTLNQVITKTLENNLQIRISDYDRQIADAEINIQKGIFDLMLSAKLSASNNEFQQPATDFPVSENKKYSGETTLSQLIPTGGILGFSYKTSRDKTNTFAIDPYYQQGGSLFFRQPLLKNFGSYMTLAGIRIAQNYELMSREAFRSMVQEQIAAVTKAYWNLVFAIQYYEVQRLTLFQAQDFLRIANVSYRTGVIPESEVLQAKARVAVQEEHVVIAESAIKATQDQLKIYMNISRAEKGWDKFYLPIDEPNVVSIQLDTESFIAAALKMRPDYLQAQIDLQNKKINRNTAKNRKLPDLSIVASAGRSGLDDSHSGAWDELNTYDYHNYTAGLELEFPLQNRAARFRYKQAVLQYEKSEEIIRNLENIIVLDIRNSVRSLETDQKRVQVTQVAVDAEKAKLDSEMQRYRVGLSTSYNVLEFQKDYAEALVRHIQSKISFNQDLIELEKAKGTLLPRFGIVDVPAIQQRLEPVSLDEVQQ